MIRIGILGAARIAPNAIIKPVSKRGDCEVIAIGCRDEARGKTFAREHNLVAATMSYKDVCTSDDVDMIYCALPPSAHREWVSLALKSGKAVLCEKPISMGIKDMQAMAEVSRQTGAPLMEAFHYFFHPVFRKVSEIVKSQMHGPVTAFEGEFNICLPFREGQLRFDAALGGGALMDLGCYPLHAFRSLIGEPEISNVKAVIDHGVDVELSARLSSPGVDGHMNCAMNLESSDQNISRIRLSFENGYLEVTGFVLPQLGHNVSYVIDGKPMAFDCEPAITYDRQLDHFIDVVNGRAPDLSLDDSIKQMTAIETIYSKCGLR